MERLPITPRRRYFRCDLCEIHNVRFEIAQSREQSEVSIGNLTMFGTRFSLKLRSASLRQQLRRAVAGVIRQVSGGWR
jgi:hypothetical protein